MPITKQSAEILKGKLIRKSWAKSAQSYCAQGSDFYVLKTETKSHILQFDEENLLKQLAENEGKIIEIQGIFKTKKIKYSKNLFSQHPITTDPEGNELDYYECQVFEVLEIR